MTPCTGCGDGPRAPGPYVLEGGPRAGERVDFTVVGWSFPAPGGVYVVNVDRRAYAWTPFDRPLSDSGPAAP